MKTKKLPPIHPGEILREEFLEPMGISQYRLAKSLSVPPRRINEIVHGKRAITADTAIRLACYFGTSPQFWMNLQGRYDLDVAEDRQCRPDQEGSPSLRGMTPATRIFPCLSLPSARVRTARSCGLSLIDARSRLLLTLTAL